MRQEPTEIDSMCVKRLNVIMQLDWITRDSMFQILTK